MAPIGQVLHPRPLPRAEGNSGTHRPLRRGERAHVEVHAEVGILQLAVGRERRLTQEPPDANDAPERDAVRGHHVHLPPAAEPRLASSSIRTSERRGSPELRCGTAAVPFRGTTSGRYLGRQDGHKEQRWHRVTYRPPAASRRRMLPTYENSSRVIHRPSHRAAASSACTHRAESICTIIGLHDMPTTGARGGQRTAGPLLDRREHRLHALRIRAEDGHAKRAASRRIGSHPSDLLA